jgi:nucleotide-binding universal stress UspA family protein
MTSPFSSILVPLDGSHIAAQSLGCAEWLASRLGARLHIVSATLRELPARDELARLKVPEKYWPAVTLQQTPAHAPAAILEACKEPQAQLVVMTSRGETGEGPAAAEQAPLKVIGHVTRAIIEQCVAPVLLLPPNYRETLPWEHILSPVSGETEVDEALGLALGLASALDLDVHVAHVADEDAGHESLSARARYADALHHEYPCRFEELVRCALPQCAREEYGRIVDVALCHGDIAAELLRLIERKQISLIVAGWHGKFITGHARVLTRLIQTVAQPVLLVKPGVRTKMRLKVATELE